MAAGATGSVRPRDGRASLVRVVAVSDRRRMVPAAVLANGDWDAIAAAFGAAVQRAVAGCAAGSVVVQVREKDLDGGPLLRLVRAAQPFAPVAVNERLDVALVAGAWGVHLPERGLAIEAARAIVETASAIAEAAHAIGGAAGPVADAADAVADAAGPVADAATSIAARRSLIIGASRHGIPGDTGADLIQLGPIWPTPSKPGMTPLGAAALAWPHGRAALVAVGGIDTPERAAEAAEAGADAVAVIRAAWAGDSLAGFVAAVEAGRARR